MSNWVLWGDINSKTGNIEWDLNTTPVPLNEAFDLVVWLKLWPCPPSAGARERASHILNKFIWEGKLPWLVEFRSSEECIVDLDELRTFSLSKFSGRVEVASSNLFQSLRGRVSVDVGYGFGGEETKGRRGRSIQKEYLQILLPICHYHLRGDKLPVVAPLELEASVSRLKADTMTYRGIGFIMMRFGDTQVHDQITETIRQVLGKYDIIGLRADEKQYHDDLLQNVLTYLYGCNFGIAIFERLESDEFNPNVSLEVGYLMALGKPVCLLKDRTLKTLHADLAGRLYRTFDPQKVQTTLPPALEGWLSDKHLIPSARKNPSPVKAGKPSRRST